MANEKKNYEQNRNRKIQVIVRLDEKEFDRLCEWSAACKKSRSNYIRELIDGYQPVEFPPTDYVEVLSELKRIGFNMNQIASKAHSLGFVDEPEYRKNVNRLWRVVATFAEQLARGGVKFGSNKDLECQKPSSRTD